MRTIILQLWLLSITICVSAQQTVFDREHFTRVIENATVRQAAELSGHALLDESKDHLEAVQTKLAATAAIELIIYRSLTQVDAALRSSLRVAQVGQLCSEIFSSCADLSSLAAQHPQFIPFANQSIDALYSRSIKLSMELSELILKEQSSLILDLEKREALLGKVLLELRVIRAGIYSIQKSIFWASQRGLLKSVNPFSSQIASDERAIGRIIQQIKTLKK
ncbi:hypothetical protein ACJVDH_15190 [Pedobacter sp. AW1-32]|uniref:hypothetical protein n=1 Tax=Pedobacter sp. AW1-32 TaxID=3383026 RepID=UPI003FF151A7